MSSSTLAGTDLVAAWRSALDTTGPSDWTYTRANTTEAFPGIVSPLTWSLLEEDCREGTSRAMIRLGLRDDVDPRPGAALGYVAGRIVANASESKKNFSRLPGSGADAAIWGRHVLAEDEQAAVPGPGLPDVPARIAAEARARQEDLRRARDTVDAALTAGLGEDASAFDRAAPLLALAWEQHTLGTLLAMLSQGALVKRAAEQTQTPQDREELTALLASAGEEVVSGGPGRRLAQLAQTVRSSGEPWSPVAADADGALDRLPAAARTELAAFLEEFGHRGPGEMDLARPSWGSAPDLLVPLLAALVRTAGVGSAPRRDVLDQVRERFGPDTAAALEPYVEQAVAMLQGREESKDLVCRVCDGLRRSVQAMGRSLHDRGLLEQAQDVFLLTETEVRSAWEGTDLSATAAARRAAAKLLEHVRLPMMFTLPVEVEPVEAAAAETGGALQGEPIVPGVVVGRARVLVDPDDAYDLLDGEVLVARTTDTAWTPLFLVAAAVVTEVGAAVSHAAIVAREFGVTTVVGVRGLTAAVRTGDLVRVDGARGTVELVSS